MTTLTNISRNYEMIFGEYLEPDRLDEIDALLHQCADWDDVEALADCDDATISFGELDAIRGALEGLPNRWNLS